MLKALGWLLVAVLGALPVVGLLWLAISEPSRLFDMSGGLTTIPSFVVLTAIGVSAAVWRVRAASARWTPSQTLQVATSSVVSL